MALSPGDLYFIGVFTDPAPSDGSGGTGSESFRVIVTRDLAAGEEIQFVAFNSTNSAQTFTPLTYEVPVGGISAFDILTFTETSDDTITVSNNSLVNGDGAITVQPTDGFSIGQTTSLTAISGNEVLAGINMSSAYNLPPSPLTLAGGGTQTISTTEITNFIATSPDPNPLLSDFGGSTGGADDNGLYTGTDLEGIDDNTQWEFNDDRPNYNTGDLGNDGSGANFATQDFNITCFVSGTMIATPEGEKRVEDLKIGQLITTHDGKAVPIKWVARQTIVKQFYGMRAAPVCISAGALGENQPRRNLIVTADHGMVLDGMIVNASALINGSTITTMPLNVLPKRFVVYHIETFEHDVILAEGAPSETFVDYVSRKVFDNYDEYLALYGEERSTIEMPHPRISSARLLPKEIRDAIAARSAA